MELYREDDVDGSERVYLKFPMHLAPVKVAVLPLMKKEPLQNLAKSVLDKLSVLGNVEYHETGSIGKRYRKMDEIGTPYCVTIDFDSLDDNCVTVRNRDNLLQERVNIDQLLEYLKS